MKQQRAAVVAAAKGVAERAEAMLALITQLKAIRQEKAELLKEADESLRERVDALEARELDIRNELRKLEVVTQLVELDLFKDRLKDVEQEPDREAEPTPDGRPGAW
jgi:hypothetical protein